jgi:endogenous inhibitor of DNA gyrase (YacG/DUF329 family)
MPRCPVCSSRVDLAKTPTAPFCSERCQTVDLARWLDEAYAVPEPIREEDEDGGEPAGSAGDED